MPAFRDLARQRFGRLVAVSATMMGGRARWLCQCDCGRQKIICGTSLTSGFTQSCGCLQREIVTARETKHGQKRRRRATPEYYAWQSAKDRCFNPNDDHYKYYGWRGITMCDRWKDSFENFFADMGPRPGPAYSLDRYPNPDGNYEPGNCRWATNKEQANNKSARPIIIRDDANGRILGTISADQQRHNTGLCEGIPKCWYCQDERTGKFMSRSLLRHQEEER